MRSHAPVYLESSGVFARPARTGLRSTYKLHSKSSSSFSNLTDPKRSPKKCPGTLSSAFAVRAIGSLSINMNQLMLLNRNRNSLIFSSSLASLRTRFGFGSGRNSKLRRDSRNQRRATSSSDHCGTMSGRLRKMTWRWLSMTVWSQTSTAKMLANDSMRSRTQSRRWPRSRPLT